MASGYIGAMLMLVMAVYGRYAAVESLPELLIIMQSHRISSKFQEERQTAYLFQRLSVTVQRYNAVILHDSFPPCSDLWPPME